MAVLTSQHPVVYVSWYSDLYQFKALLNAILRRSPSTSLLFQLDMLPETFVLHEMGPNETANEFTHP